MIKVTQIYILLSFLILFSATFFELGLVSIRSIYLAVISRISLMIRKLSSTIMANPRALLVMTSPLGQVMSKLANYLPAVIQARNPRVLYVHLTQNNCDNIGQLSSTITNIYQNGGLQCNELDLCVTFNDSSLEWIKRPFEEVFIEPSGVDIPVLKLFGDSQVTILHPLQVRPFLPSLNNSVIFLLCQKGS